MLCLWNISEEFVLVVLLVSFLSIQEWKGGGNASLDVVELFAGVGRIGKLASWMGYRSRAFDLTYTPVRNPETKFKRGKHRRGAMDLNGNAGFVNLA